MTRDEYEKIVARWKTSPVKGSRFNETRVDSVLMRERGDAPFMSAHLERRCTIADVCEAAAIMAVEAMITGSYLVMHVNGKEADIRLSVTRELDEADDPKIEPCDTVAKAAGVGGPG